MGRSHHGAAAISMILATASAQAQTLGQGTDDPVSLWRVAASLLLCLFVAIGAAFALKARRSGRGWSFGLTRNAIGPLVRRERRLALIDSLRLPNQTDLCLVTCDGRSMLLATTAHGLQVLPVDAGPTAPEAETEGTE